MKLSCPVCNSKFTLSQAVHEASMREMIELAARFGKNWNLIYDYTECFRSSQWGSVGEAKRLRILQDVDKLFQKAEFEYDGKKYRTDWPKIIGAIRVIVDMEKHGFKNHNYLKKVLLGRPFDGAQGRGAERVSAEGMTAREEQERESKRMNVEHRTSNVEHPMEKGPENEGTAIDYKRRKGIESLAEKIGKKISFRQD